jgi:ferredoxin
MLYFIPTITRSEVFVNFLKGHDTESVLEIFNIARNKALFGILDGIKTAISYDESVNSMNVLMFSEDLLSLDAMLSVLIGFRSSEVPTNELGNAFDFGNGILKRIDIFGDEFEKLRKEAIKNLRFASSLNRRKSSAPYINTVDANSIRIAMNFCPTGAIIEENGNFSIDKNKCIKCNFCLEIANEIFKIS